MLQRELCRGLKQNEHHQPCACRSGRSSDEYLPDLVETGGEAVSAVEVSPREPDVLWISHADGTRAEEELDARATEVVGDVLVVLTMQGLRVAAQWVAGITYAPDLPASADDIGLGPSLVCPRLPLLPSRERATRNNADAARP